MDAVEKGIAEPRSIVMVTSWFEVVWKDESNNTMDMQAVNNEVELALKGENSSIVMSRGFGKQFVEGWRRLTDGLVGI